MPARQAQDDLVEARLAKLAPDELADDAAGDIGVDRELGRQLEQAARVHRVGHRRHRRTPGWKPIGRSIGSPGATSRPGSAPSSAVVSGCRPARSATIRDSSRTASSGRSSRSSGNRHPFASDVRQRDVDGEEALLEERRREERLAGRGDHLRAAPERDRLVDPDPVAEDDERGRELGVGPHDRPPRRRGPEPDLVRRREVAAGRRRDVDQHLGAVEGKELRNGQVPEVLADREPHPDPQPRRRRPQEIARGEEAALVEQAVGRQEQLPVDVADPAVLEQRRRDEQAMVAGLLDERDHDRQVLRLRGKRSEARIVEADRDFRGEVLEQVAGQPQLGEDDEPGPLRARLAEELVMEGEVLVEHPESGGDLGEGDPERRHERRIAVHGRADRVRRPART